MPPNAYVLMRGHAGRLVARAWGGAGASGEAESFEKAGGAGLLLLDREEAVLEARLPLLEVRDVGAHIRPELGDEPGVDRS